MKDYFSIFITTIFTNNVVLVKFLGLCPIIAVSKKLETTIGMTFTMIFVITLSSICSWIIDNLILIPLNLIYLRIFIFILITSVVVQCTEIMLYKTNKILYRKLGIFLPLMTTNCTILSVILLNTHQSHSFLEAAVYGFSTAISFSLIMILFSAIKERISLANIPAPFKGAPIALITIGLMSLAFIGFNDFTKLK
ncbi:Electron transport complex protein RnfA [Candidatus Arsenophonus lipoptenae]|uniref:Electron transport complex protein RnfA n=1 Tax=Candidatus Arsenophonus lipoptenae TaxID=634113 RepID=A0A0X9W291_9GAMM|nr:electron transport complex subunit RsxA [Candidatus Arsenophonus lipoptenae]AMA64639.1 Electron transport complex protein RnfA [Candidatus Arsenophonus lipoptenae]